MLGSPVHATFGISFPIRFDYLDTFGGGNLSVHGHPRQAYMRSVFGWPYTRTSPITYRPVRWPRTPPARAFTY